MTRRHLIRIAKKLPRCRPGLPHLPHALPVEMAHVAQWFFAASDITRLYILELLKYFGLEGETLKHLIAFALIVSPEKHRGTCALYCCRHHGDP